MGGGVIATFIFLLRWMSGSVPPLVIDWGTYLVLVVPTITWVLLLIYITVGCAEGAWVSLGGLLISDTMVFVVLVSFAGTVLLNQAFFLRFITWRGSFVARYFHGGRGWRTVIRELRWGCVSSIKEWSWIERIERFIENKRRDRFGVDLLKIRSYFRNGRLLICM